MLKVILFTTLIFCCTSLSFAKSNESITIVSDVKIPPFKRDVTVRLNKRMSTRDLRTVALNIRSLDNRSYERTFITYYLPWQRLKADTAWATSHFTPALEVDIVGATTDELNKLKGFSVKEGWAVPGPRQAKTLKLLLEAQSQVKPKLRQGGTIIGEYIWELGRSSHKITILHCDGNYLINTYFLSGEQSTKIVRGKKVRRGLRLEEDYAPFGEYYLVNKGGDLELHDEDHGENGKFIILKAEK